MAADDAKRPVAQITCLPRYARGGADLLVSVTQMGAARNSVKPASAQPRRDRKFADSLLERTGFELVVPDLSETFLYPSGAVNWPGSHSRF